jgi:hypothetical protein
MSLAAARYGMGYTTTPHVGTIQTLHAIDPESGRTLCGQAVAISWSAQDAAGTQIDCRSCLARIGREGDRR